MMKYKIKIAFLAILVLPILFFACEKERNPESVISGLDPEVILNTTIYGKGILLKWTTTTGSPTFEKYIVVRSNSPLISNYEPNVQSNLLIYQTDDEQINSFLDLDFPMIEKVYYTLFIDLGNRYVKSTEVAIETGVYKWEGVNTSLRTRYSTELDLFYFFYKSNFERHLSVFDLTTKQVLATKIFPLDFNIEAIAFSEAVGLDEVYLERWEDSLGTYCEVLDARTLEVKNTLMLTSNNAILQFTSNKLGHLCYKGTGNWKVIDAADGSSFASFNSMRNSDFLFNIDNDDLSFVAIGEDRIEHVKFDDMGNVTDMKFEIREKTLANNTAVAPDGQRFLAYLDGVILNKELEIVGQLGEGSKSFRAYNFSPDGTKIFAIEMHSSTISQYDASTLEWERDFEYDRSNTLIRSFYIEGNRMIIMLNIDFELVIQAFDYTL